MTNEQMERRLASAVEKTAPDDVSGVLSCWAAEDCSISRRTRWRPWCRWM